MILVTLGTNDKSFVRLIEKIEELVQKGVIDDRVVVQAGYTKYESENLEIFDLIPMEQFNELLKTCDLLITHGGVGSIITGLKNAKTVVAVPRLEKYGEHVNDHQYQIIENFENSGYILAAYDVEELENVLEKVSGFQAKKYSSNTGNMIELVRKYIDE